MPTFNYQGRNEAGLPVAGSRTAQSADSVSQQLFKEGITPITITSAAENLNQVWAVVTKILPRKRVTKDELSLFARQMYAICNAGVPITTALKQLSQNASTALMAQALNEMAADVEAGHPLADAMQKFPVIFTPLMMSMIQIGQATGNLAQAFLNLNQYLQLESTATKNLKTALRYPMFILITLVTALFLLNIFVIPTFANIFNHAQIPLPIFTVILINFSGFFIHYWLALLIMTGLLATWGYYYFTSEVGKLAWDKGLLKMPLAGSLIRRLTLLRFSKTFSIVINAGVPLIEGMHLVAKAMDNHFAEQEIMKMIEGVQRGSTLPQVASLSSLFSPLELQMLSISEKTGDLGAMLEHIADFYQDELDFELKRLSENVGAVLLVIVTILILILALAVYLPIWNMVKLVHS